ncbi:MULTISPECIES: hypothetical protein [unclassified Streptomyces]|uniref:hypothetical protein n=1 Tax=unclassified Streptomyces TaxID=2593676 RepID=UPI0022544FAE|nr:hypothetical protein [Streptomyces sp. NBC_00047]MCX5613590.1 hypothetical protein [Streptomyces sp. NBC_00047]
MALLLLAGAAASACSASAQPGGVSASASGFAPPPLTSSDALVLPLDAYLPSQEDTKQEVSAYRVLLRSCMRRLGSAYAPPPLGEFAGPRTQNERRYGLTDGAMAAEHGYHMPGAASEAPEAQPSPRDLFLLKGTGGDGGEPQPPEGGCVGEAKGKISSPEDEARLRFARDLGLRSYAESKEDPRVREVNRRWSACMRGKGFDFPDPMAAIGAAAFAGPALGEGEQRTAVADVECKARVNVIGVWAAVEAERQRNIIAENADALAAEKKSKDAKTAAVHSALATAPPSS